MMTTGEFELLEHTADIGIRFRGQSADHLLLAGAAGLYACIGEIRTIPGTFLEQDLRLELPDERPLGEQHRRARPEDGRGLLLRDFLAELLFLFEQSHRVVAALDAVRFTDLALSCRMSHALVDRAASVYYREVKAITFHDLYFRELEDPAQPGHRFEARVIVDI